MKQVNDTESLTCFIIFKFDLAFHVFQSDHREISPPHSLQVSIYPRVPSLDAAHQFTLSISNTRFNRCAQALAYRKGGSLPFDEHGQMKL